MSKCVLLTSLLVLTVSYSQGQFFRRISPDPFRSVLLGDRSEEKDDSSPHVFVELGNGYCDFQKPFGPSCNMTGSNAVLTVQENPQLSSMNNFLEVEVHNASMILLYPTCLPWVQLFGVRDLVTKQPQDKGSAGSSCRTWLRSYNSHLGSLNSGLRDLSLVNSSVDVIALHDLRDFLALSSNVSVIQHLDWQGYAGLVRDARIGSIVSMKCNDNISMAEVVIDTIGWGGFTFAGDSMKVNTTTFGKVSTKGIDIVKGEAKFFNSVFKDLAIYGLTVEPGSYLRMQNVSVEKCEQPCLVVPYSDSAVFENVTIEGMNLENVLGAVLYFREDHATVENFTLQNSAECHTDSENAEIIFCDFKNSNQNVFVSEYDDYANVTINDSSNFHIIGVCKLNLTLNNSSGLYTSNSATINSSCTSGEDGGSLSATNTTFHGLDTRHLTHLILRNCSVSSLHTRAPLQQVEFRDSAPLDVLWLMVSDGAEWADSSADVTTASVGNLQASRMHFSKVLNLTIGDNSGNSTISDSTFDWCTIHGLTVTGSLVLTNVTFKETASLPIFLVEGARLYLQDVSFPDRHTRHVISAANQEQVVWLKQDDGQPTSELVYVRPSQPDIGQVSIVGQKPCIKSVHFGLSSVITFGRVRISPISTISCDYNNTALGGNVVMRQLPLPYPTIVIISAARNLTLESFCSTRITVTSVEWVTMDEKDSFCSYELLGFSSSFGTITNHPTGVALHNSRAHTIESSGILQTLQLVNTSVEVMSTSVESTTILNSSISDIYFLNALGDAQFDYSFLGTIRTLALHSNSSITNCVISSLGTGGIHIYDKLLIANVTIHLMDRNSIVLKKDAHLVMSNVTITEGWITSFQFSPGSLTLKNVTLNGTPLIERDDFIMTATTPPEPSTATKARRQTTASTPTMPRTPSPSVSPVSFQPRTKATLVPAGPDARNTDMDTGGGTQPWMHWAGTGAAIFMALLGVFIILSIAIVVRTHRRGQPLLTTLSSFFGRKMEDQTFLATEMEPTVRDPSVTHYVRLPS